MLPANRLIAATAVLLVAGFATASAADLDEPLPVASPSMFDLAFGVTTTTNYIGRGISQTNAGGTAQFAPAIQPFLEATYGIAYAGLWASNVNFGAPNFGEWEVDLSAGIRPTFGALSLDLGYVYYLYTDSADTDEIYLLASLAVNDSLTVGGKFYTDPGPWSVYAEGTAALALPAGAMPFTPTLSGAVGYNTLLGGYWTWNAGMSFEKDPFTLDLRYHDTNIGPAYFVASLSVKTSWSALRGVAR